MRKLAGPAARAAPELGVLAGAPSQAMAFTPTGLVEWR